MIDTPHGQGHFFVMAEASHRIACVARANRTLPCIGFTERHRAALAALDMPAILSVAVKAKAVGELLGG